MDLVLQNDLEHQVYAVNAVCSVFENVSMIKPTFYYMNPLINVKDKHIEKNINKLQEKVAKSQATFMEAKEYLHIDIKMETGTGKTYVYTKTIYELHKRYGINKFVIAVPSIPIKEGAKSFISDNYVKKFFSDTCGYGCDIELCTVDSIKKKSKGKKYFPSIVREYVTGSEKAKNKIYVLLVNMALLTGSSKTGLLTRNDYDSSVENYFNPLEAIGATRPIVIIDEPHRFSRDQKAYEVIENKLRPQCVIRYGATFPDITIGKGKRKVTNKDYCNLIYNLDAYVAFEKGLIKGIAKEHFKPISKNQAKVKILGIENSKVRLQYKSKETVKSYELEKNDSLSLISTDFGNLTITGIAKDRVILSNGLEKRVGSDFEVDLYANSYQEQMIKLALKRHFETERVNFNGDDPVKIKTLALFFIDDVYSYRNKDISDKNTPFLKEIFNKLLCEEINNTLSKLKSFESEYKEYLLATLADLDAAQAGYFAQDNNESDENIKKEVDDILRDKKGLLAIKNTDGSYNTRRFLFSKWTLKEGWDNPNVFTIAKLRSSGSDISKLQEVGRGLRLPVNTLGNRVSNEEFELNYIVDFTEADFAEKLISEINGEHQEKFYIITDEQLNKIVSKRQVEKEKIFSEMLLNGFIDIDRNIIEDKFNELLDKYPELRNVQSINKVKDKNKTKEEKVTLNKNSYDKIKELWMLLNQKYTLQYDEIIDQQIEAALPEIILKSLTTMYISSVRSSLEIREGNMIVEESGDEYYSVSKPMKYNEFLQRINKMTNIPITKLHHAFCIVHTTYPIESEKINERTVINIVNRFSDWKYENLKGHFTYKKADIPIIRTALTNSDGSPVDSISKLYIGSKDVDGKINANYLYNALAYDSDLELENIKANIEDVIVYGKIPRKSIAIPTIDGQTYSPDFIYILKEKDGSQSLNLVVETKNYERESSLRKEEQYRIKCAEAFFEALKADGINVTYRQQLKNDKILNIIENVLEGNVYTDESERKAE